MKLALVLAIALVALLAWALTQEDTQRAPRTGTDSAPTLETIREPVPEPQTKREFRPSGSAFADLPGRLKIEVVNESHEKLPGIALTIKGRRTTELLRTDGDGWAYFSPDQSGRFEIYIHPPPPYAPYLAETRHIDASKKVVRVPPPPHPPGLDEALRKGPRQRFVRYMLRRGLEITIHVEIDGVAGLPDEYTLDGPSLTDRKDDRASGTIRGRFVPDGERLQFGIRAKGMMGGGTTTFVRDPGAPVHLRLWRAVPLEMHVHGDPAKAMFLKLERHSVQRRWGEVASPVTFGNDADTEGLTIREFVVGMGRFRVVLPGQIVVQEFEVAAGSRGFMLPVDLRRAQWLRFKSVLPEESREPYTTVGVEIGGAGRVGINARIVHPGDRALRFTLDSWILSPHPTRGSVVSNAGGTITLEAVTSATIRFDWPRIGDDLVRGHDIFRIDTDGTRHNLGARFHYDSYRFFGPRGTHDYIICTREFAPLVLRGVHVKGDTHDLGMLKPGAGQTLRIRPKNLAKGEVLICSAHWIDLDLPLGTRIAYGTRPHVEFRTLPKGRIRIEFRVRGKTWQREFASKGVGSHAWTVPIPR